MEYPTANVHRVLIPFFRLHDLAADFLTRHLMGVKRALHLIAHLTLFGFLFPDLRIEFGKYAFYVLLYILFLSPLSKIFRARLLLLLMSIRREFGILFGYLVSVHVLGFLLDPLWFDFTIRPFLSGNFFGIDPRYIFGIFAYVCTLPLLLTSNRIANTVLGKNWKRLHRLAYFVLAFSVFHKYLFPGEGFGGANSFRIVEALILLGLYGFLKLLARQNFLPPLRKLNDWVASEYRVFKSMSPVSAQTADPPPPGPGSASF